MGKTVFITGGSRGIGKACALAFAKEGYKVILNYLQSHEKAEEVKKEIEELGSECLLLPFDISDSEATKEAIRQARVYYKDISLLINNAAISYRKLFDQVTEEESQRIINVNIHGMLHVTKEILPFFLQQEHGHILNISSCWAKAGASLEVHYSLTKGAVDSFTKALARELAPSGIRVNAIAPGAVETDMLGILDEKDQRELKNLLACSEIEKPENIAAMAVFLESKYGKNITGQILSFDGGLVI